MFSEHFRESYVARWRAPRRAARTTLTSCIARLAIFPAQTILSLLLRGDGNQMTVGDICVVHKSNSRGLTIRYLLPRIHSIT
jgi:hypothetical protein